MKSIIDKPFGLLAIFVALLGIELFVFYLLADSGLLPTLLAEDYSFISRVILVIYLGASLHVMLVSYYLSIESNDLNGSSPRRSTGSSVARYLSLLGEPSGESDESGELLIDVLDGRCRGKFRFGYVIADLMLKLGLLGTVIGFIFMLASVAEVSSVDIHALQQLLTNMSSGMRVALYTTLTGLGAGILLGFQYRLLDRAVDRLMAEIIELSEVHVTAHLRRLISD